MLIAETGGLNAMIVDSTALLEQATRDIVRAAFQSAGQRCSALRVLYVQKDVEAELLEMLSGAMDALVTGDPWDIATDVAPVIDAEARAGIAGYIEAMAAEGRVLKQVAVPEDGLFVPPTVIRVSGIGEVEREVFGPVLHVASFDGDRIEEVVAEVNARGYGLTFGLHTRIDSRVQRVLDRVHVGNVYVNRDQIGAIVGSQPFGGHGLSGTGPKAGGPFYVPRFKAPVTGAMTEVPEGRPVSVGEAEAALSRLKAGDWAVAPDRIARLRGALRGRAAEAVSAAARLDFGPVDLPGPTGESNQYELGPRGIVLCLGPGPETLVAQVVQALAAGNRVLAVAPGAVEATRPLRKAGLPVAALDGVAEPEMLATLPLELVALSTGPAGAAPVRAALADRPGPVVTLVTQVIDPTSYANERAICIDTTAAGWKRIAPCGSGGVRGRASGFCRGP